MYFSVVKTFPSFIAIRRKLFFVIIFLRGIHFYCWYAKEKFFYLLVSKIFLKTMSSSYFINHFCQQDLLVLEFQFKPISANRIHHLRQQRAIKKQSQIFSGGKLLPPLVGDSKKSSAVDQAKKREPPEGEDGRPSEGEDSHAWKPSVYRVLLYLGLISLVVELVAAAVFSQVH